jgi:phage terminase Nu1 subunit (DNA packaging protein)
MTGLFPDLADAAEPKEVSKSGMAEILGVVPGRITQLIGMGLPVLPSGRIEVAAGRAWYEANINPDRRKHRPDGHLSAAEELKRIRVQQARLDLQRAQGALIDRKAAETVIFARARAERDAHLAFVARISPALAQRLEIDPAKLFAELDREMRDHLAKLAETPIEELPHDAG